MHKRVCVVQELKNGNVVQLTPVVVLKHVILWCCAWTAVALLDRGAAPVSAGSALIGMPQLLAIFVLILEAYYYNILLIQLIKIYICKGLLYCAFLAQDMLVSSFLCEPLALLYIS